MGWWSWVIIKQIKQATRSKLPRASSMPPRPLHQLLPQTPEQFEFLPWLPSVNSESKYVTQINSFLPWLLLVMVFQDSANNSTQDRLSKADALGSGMEQTPLDGNIDYCYNPRTVFVLNYKALGNCVPALNNFSAVFSAVVLHSDRRETRPEAGSRSPSARLGQPRHLFPQPPKAVLRSRRSRL